MIAWFSVVFGINSTRNASRKGTSTQLRFVLFSPFLLALLILSLPNNTENHAINYTNHTLIELPYIYSYRKVCNFYQPAVREARGRLVLRLLRVFRVCWYIYICASALITCAIIMSRSLHCCHVTLLSRLRQFRRPLCAATTNSLAQLRVRDGYREAEAT